MAILFPYRAQKSHFVSNNISSFLLLLHQISAAVPRLADLFADGVIAVLHLIGSLTVA